MNLVALDGAIKGSDEEKKIYSVLKFPTLFDSDAKSIQAGFPTRFTAGFLKISDYWIVASNKFRVFLLQVLEQSQNHVSKMSTYQELLKNFSIVLQCNDPIAKAMTIRALGYLSEVSFSSLELQHQIFECLKQNIITDFEFSAAVFTGSRIAAKSPEFAWRICNLVYDHAVGTEIQKGSRSLDNLYLTFEHLNKNLDHSDKVTLVEINIGPSHVPRANSSKCLY